MVERNQASKGLPVVSSRIERRPSLLILVAVVLLAVTALGTFRTDHILRADGSQSYERSILGVIIEPWSEEGYLECPTHLDYARTSSTPILLSSCFTLFGCTRYELAFYEAGCGG